MSLILLVELIAMTEIQLFSSIIGAPNNPPALPIQNHFCPFFVFGVPLVMAHGASIGQYYWCRGHRCVISIRIISKIILFRSPCLFSCKSPINWALQNRSGNMLKRRGRQH
jgi:hypothetical protein